jgi:hypothetical protein
MRGYRITAPMAGQLESGVLSDEDGAFSSLSTQFA